jgi:hypothetical protein
MSLSMPRRCLGGIYVQPHLFLSSALDGSEWSTSCLAALARGMNPGTYPAPEPVWTVCRRETHLTLTGFKGWIAQLAISRPWVGVSHTPQDPNYALLCFFGSAAQRVLWPPRTTRFLDHKQRRTTVGRTLLGRVINSSQRPLPDDTQRTQHTNIHAPGEIRNHDRNRRAAVDLRLRPRGHWDRLCPTLRTLK